MTSLVEILRQERDWQGRRQKEQVLRMLTDVLDRAHRNMSRMPTNSHSYHPPTDAERAALTLVSALLAAVREVAEQGQPD